MGSDCGGGEFGVGAVASGTVVALGTRGVIGVMVSDESPPPPPRVLYFLQFFVRVGTAPTDLEILEERSTFGFNNTGDMGKTIETFEFSGYPIKKQVTVLGSSFLRKGL
ncbi:hypothetical protein Hanom_Chr00s000008g01616061 [Helianthus anomalus]